MCGKSFPLGKRPAVEGRTYGTIKAMECRHQLGEDSEGQMVTSSGAIKCGERRDLTCTLMYFLDALLDEGVNGRSCAVAVFWMIA